VVLNYDDTTKLEFCYDGHMRALVYHDVKGIVIDNFKVRPLPFRPLSPPFFNHTKNIIRYTLQTEDSISVDLEDFGDYVYFKLVINEDKQVEFFGEAHYMPENPYIFGETTSMYELWINKSNDLPYKVRREMSHDISVTTCIDFEINKVQIEDFNAFAYFPHDYEIREYSVRGGETAESDMLGKVAPDWVLNDANELPIALKDLKSKVLLINFTGIGCGPCQASIPFLKELVNDLSDKDFELVAIESWVKNTHSLKNYANRNSLTYKFLSASDDVVEKYHTHRAVPVFFILDEQRVIRKVIRGYSAETTGKEIRDAIIELI